MRKAASMARGAPSEISVPMLELMTRSTLMTPRPRLTGSISCSTRLRRGSLQSKEIRSGKPTRLRTGTTIASWTAVATRTPTA